MVVTVMVVNPPLPTLECEPTMQELSRLRMVAAASEVASDE